MDWNDFFNITLSDYPDEVNKTTKNVFEPILGIIESYEKIMNVRSLNRFLSKLEFSYVKMLKSFCATMCKVNSEGSTYETEISSRKSYIHLLTSEKVHVLRQPKKSYIRDFLNWFSILLSVFRMTCFQNTLLLWQRTKFFQMMTSAWFQNVGK